MTNDPPHISKRRNKKKERRNRKQKKTLKKKRIKEGRKEKKKPSRNNGRNLCKIEKKPEGKQTEGKINFQAKNALSHIPLP